MDAAKQEQEAEQRDSIDSATAHATAAAQSAGESELLRADLQRAEDGLAQTEAALEKQTAVVAELTRSVSRSKGHAPKLTTGRGAQDHRVRGQPTAGAGRRVEAGRGETAPQRECDRKVQEEA